MGDCYNNMKDNKTLQIIAFFILLSAFIRIFTHLSESWLLSVAIIALCIALYDVCELAIEGNAETQIAETEIPPPPATHFTSENNDLHGTLTVKRSKEPVPITFKQRIINTGLFYGLIVGFLTVVPNIFIKFVKIICTWVVPVFVAFCLFLYYSKHIDIYVMLAEKVGHLEEPKIEESFQNLIEIFDLLSLSLVIFGLAYRDRKKKKKPTVAVFG